MEEAAGYADMAIGIIARIYAHPVGAGRQSRGRRMDAGIDPGDQVELPRPPLDLPHAQRREAHASDQREREEPAAPCVGCQEPKPPAGAGIILPLIWYMIQSDPVITISTITAVKI